MSTPTPDSDNKPTVFLDFDGVINTDDTFKDVKTWRDLFDKDPSSLIDPSKVALLNLLAEAGAEFVLSTHWGHRFSEEDLVSFLVANGFKGKVVGETPKKMSSSKTSEIYWYLERHPKLRNFVILDDHEIATAYAEPEYKLGGERLVRTNSSVGLTLQDVYKAANLLGLQLRESDHGDEISQGL